MGARTSHLDLTSLLGQLKVMKQLLSLVVTQDTTQQQSKTNIVWGEFDRYPSLLLYAILHPFGTQDLEVH